MTLGPIYESITGGGTISGDLDVLGDLTVGGSMTLPTLQLGFNTQSGSLILYSEQGVTDYSATLMANTAMAASATFYLPSDLPAATYHMVMDNGGVIGFDNLSPVYTTTDQTVGGVKTFTSFPVTPNGNPSTNLEVANKQYVDTVALGLGPKAAVNAATTAALPACTYSGTPNFTLTKNAPAGALGNIDDVAVVAGNRVLVKDQADKKQNGIYDVTDAGGGTQWVLTRSSDSNSSADVAAGSFTFVQAGTVNAGRQYFQSTDSAVLDTNDLVYEILSSPIADTLDTVTSVGSVTTNAITIGGTTNTGKALESSITNLVAADSPYTVVAADRHIYCRSVAGAIEILLPAATGSGRLLSIGRRDSGSDVTVTADTGGVADTINGEAQVILSSIYDDMTIHDCATNEWSIK